MRSRRDFWTWFSLMALSLLFLLQTVSVGGIWVTRLRFGSHFDPILYSEYQIEKTEASVKKGFGLVEAQQAREAAAKAAQQDPVALSATRAAEEVVRNQARNNENEVVRKDSEHRADLLIHEAELYQKYQTDDHALDRLKSALEIAPDYLPALLALAHYHENHREWTQARFVLEKAASIMVPGSAELDQLQKHLATIPTAEGLLENTSLYFVQAKRQDLPLDGMYDLRFNLQVLISSRNNPVPIDPEQVRVEATFYDESRTAAGTLIPIRVLHSILRPRPSTQNPQDQLLSLNYSVPKGYFQKNMSNYGGNYDFCGYTLKLYYKGVLRDAYALPAVPLEKYALANTPHS